MSVPDVLVQAAAEALIDFYGENAGSQAFHEANRGAATAALQAAFAKLPVVAPPGFDQFLYDTGLALPGNVRVVRARIFDALAKEFGGGENVDTGHTSHSCDCGHHWDRHMAVVGGCAGCSCKAHPPNQPLAREFGGRE